MLIVHSDAFVRSRLATVTVVALTGSLRLIEAPGNVVIPAGASGLPRDSVANVSQGITVDRRVLTERLKRLPAALVEQIDEGLRLALDL